MLTDAEYQDVRALLVAVAVPAASPRQLLVAGLHPELAERLGEGEPGVLVDRALDLCKEDGWRRTPPALVRLLETLLPDRPAVAAIVQRLGSLPPPSPPDPFDALVLVSKLPFLDRRSTRAALKRFLQPTPTQPVMVVNGPRRAGKSYTGEFIDHVLYFQERVRHCLVQLDAAQGSSTGPQELARDLVTAMGGDPGESPPAATNLERWAQELANWVISVANSSGRDWWIMLDGFNTAELRPDTRLLITKLAKSLTTGVARERHRLVLTDFDRSILPLQPGLIAVETTTPIPHASVAQAVAEVVGRSPLPLEVEAVTAKVLDGLVDPVADLPELGLRLSDLIASVEPAPDGG